MEKPEELTVEELEKKLIKAVAEYMKYQKPAPKEFDDVFFTDFKNLLA